MLAGKTAVITGSTSGIGLGIAEALAGSGCNVVINGRKETEHTRKICKKMADTCQVKVLYQAADLSNLTDIKRMIASTQKELGSVDILVNNAGVQHVSPLEDFPAEKWDLLIALNLSAAFHTMRLTLPDMKKNDWGRIINVSSVHGQVASINKAAYVASKHGLIGLTKVCALENAENGITANTICPGWVRTPLVEEQIATRAEKSGRSIEEEASELLSEKQPSKTFTTPEDLGATVLYLCSDAAAQMTGSTLTLDGGWTAQ